MKRTYLIVLLAIAFFWECIPTAPIKNYDEFFPLKIGNTWYYNRNNTDTTTIDEIWEVTRENKINNKDYFEILKRDPHNNFVDTVYFRLDANKLFAKGVADSEQIVADFTLNLDDTAYWRTELKVSKKTETVITFETRYTGADYGYSITYEKGKGITSSENNGFVYIKTRLIKFEKT